MEGQTTYVSTNSPSVFFRMPPKILCASTGDFSGMGGRLSKMDSFLVILKVMTSDSSSTTQVVSVISARRTNVFPQIMVNPFKEKPDSLLLSYLISLKRLSDSESDSMYASLITFNDIVDTS